MKTRLQGECAFCAVQAYELSSANNLKAKILEDLHLILGWDLLGSLAKLEVLVRLPVYTFVSHITGGDSGYEGLTNFQNMSQLVAH
eukprot:TRINITY_DN1135_c0_g1_i1.p1 TRINITY_DN1135_c0_g1~~TRINITY_DN1135_c0_g1_i1.p1  ORF type:complete len:86 (-),score=16.91 TRINITY_DN1135_c0_g1_i1:347-604(-)